MADRSTRPTGRDGDGALVFNGDTQRLVVMPIAKATRTKGFVFARHDSGKEVFLHRTASFDTAEEFDALVEGDQIDCKIRETHKGWRAVDAQRVE